MITHDRTRLIDLLHKANSRLRIRLFVFIGMVLRKNVPEATGKIQIFQIKWVV